MVIMCTTVSTSTVKIRITTFALLFASKNSIIYIFQMALTASLAQVVDSLLVMEYYALFDGFYFTAKESICDRSPKFSTIQEAIKLKEVVIKTKYVKS